MVKESENKDMKQERRKRRNDEGRTTHTSKLNLSWLDSR